MVWQIYLEFSLLPKVSYLVPQEISVAEMQNKLREGQADLAEAEERAELASRSIRSRTECLKNASGLNRSSLGLTRSPSSSSIRQVNLKLM